MEHISKYLELKIPLSARISEKRANCFNAVQLSWKDVSDPAFTGPNEFIAYLESKFRQLTSNEESISYDVSVVWTRSASIPPTAAIRTDALNRRDEGYPFGLIIEHAFVLLDKNTVFQKRDPSELGAYEVITHEQAIGPYFNLSGFDLTHHRRR